MDKINVLVTVNVDEALLEKLGEVSATLNIVHRPARTVTEIPPDVWDDVEILLTGSVLPDRETAPNLRWVQVASAGVDRFVTKALFEGGAVMLTNTSGMHAVTMGEQAIGMMIAHARELPRMLEDQVAHSWSGSGPYTPALLRGATVGIVGYGSIGREVARLARAFGMEVLATKRDARNPAGGVEYVQPGTGDPDGTLCHRLYPAQALKSMLSECDHVVLLTPLTPETENLLDVETLAAMKPGAFLVNMARGGIVDEDALLAALESGALGGAAFDVFAEEPLLEDSPLWDAPNMIISPHMAGVQPDYMGHASDVFIENLQRYLSNRQLLNVVDMERGY